MQAVGNIAERPNGIRDVVWKTSQASQTIYNNQNQFPFTKREREP